MTTTVPATIATPQARREGRPGLGGAAVTLFSGGRGAASIARELLGVPGLDLSVLVNGYDNGLSTGVLRRYLPGMLGPSDFRKNLLLHLRDGDPLVHLLEHRLSCEDELRTLIAALTGSRPDGAAPRVRAAVARELTAVLDRTRERPGLDMAGCALGNLILTGAYLRLGEDFNAAVRSCATLFRSPVRLLNVTNGENAYLAALKADGRLLADEADIVAPQDGVAITRLFLLREPPDRLPADRLDEARATVTLNPGAAAALRDADLIVYGPGTPHSSLLPSYLTPGIGEVIGESAAAKVFVVNLAEDHDVRGVSPSALVRLTLDHLGDPANERPTVTHVLTHRAGLPGPRPAGSRHGARWIAADLADPDRPGVHSGPRTLAALAALADGAALLRAG